MAGLLIYSKNGDLAPLAPRTGAGMIFTGNRARRKGLYQGLAKLIDSPARALAMKPEAVIFDMVGLGKEADRLRRSGVAVWGAGRLQDEMELDRVFGIDVMARAGIRIPTTVAFYPGEGMKVSQVDLEDRSGVQRVRGRLPDAAKFAAETGLRWVLKPVGNEAPQLSYVSKSAEDLVRFLEHVEAFGEIPADAVFLLQQYIAGAEVSTEVFTSEGEIVPGSANGTIETKKFLAGDLGPNTGCQTSVVWGYEDGARIVVETFERLRPWLRAPDGPDGKRRLPYHGPLDINCIVSEEDHLPYGLEWTSRFGYNAIYALLALLLDDPRDLLVGLARGTLPGVNLAAGYAYALRVTIPPYPELDAIHGDSKEDQAIIDRLLEKATHVQIIGPVEDERVWLLDAQADPSGDVWTAGVDGVVMEITATGGGIEPACREAHELFEEFEVADAMARTTDGADRAVRDTIRLFEWGYDVPKNTDLLDRLDRETCCRIGRSELHGVGVVAVRDIPEGSDPFGGDPEMPFYPVDPADVQRLDPGARQVVEDFCQQEEGFLWVPARGMNAITVSAFMNHSDAPNVEVSEDGNEARTTRPIAAGEELTVDYRTYDERPTPAGPSRRTPDGNPT